MRSLIQFVAVLVFSFSLSVAEAQNKVVVVPLGGTKTDVNLLPENIVYGVTIFGVTGTQVPASMTVASAGKIWMDRNLGASRVAISMTDTEAYGNLYQWGRLTDGHQSRTSPTTSTPSDNDIPGHGSFILTSSDPYDWRNPQNGSLWQGVDGINNPCPAGFRLPTDLEWDAERASWVFNYSDGAFASPLKLVPAGYRVSGSGGLSGADSSGSYWSSTVNGSYSRYLFFSSAGAFTHSYNRAGGFSVRCIKD